MAQGAAGRRHAHPAVNPRPCPELPLTPVPPAAGAPEDLLEHRRAAREARSEAGAGLVEVVAASTVLEVQNL